MVFIMQIVRKVVCLGFLIPILVSIPTYGVGNNIFSPVWSQIWNTDMRINLQRCTGLCNKKYCNISHVCRPINRTSKIKSLDIYLRSGITLEAPLYVEIVGYKKFRTEYRQYMIRIKEELCPLLLYKNHTLFKLADRPLLDRIKNGVYGNFLDPCPFTGHRYLKPRTTNSVDDSYHIPLIPIGEWRMDVILSLKNGEHIVTYSDYYEVKATGAVEF